MLQRHRRDRTSVAHPSDDARDSGPASDRSAVRAGESEARGRYFFDAGADSPHGRWSARRRGRGGSVGRAERRAVPSAGRRCAALDPHALDGPDGVPIDGRIDNGETLPLLAVMAMAWAGADRAALSDVMDGRVAAIRPALDEAGFTGVALSSYCSSCVPAFDGPLREALDSAALGNEKRTRWIPPTCARPSARWCSTRPRLPRC
jgi:porphobilinogen synthase